MVANLPYDLREEKVSVDIQSSLVEPVLIMFPAP
jgi:hypothetical protein